MQKNQIVDLEITDLSYEAMGVAHLDGMTVFVNNALPGEIVSAKILKVKKNFAFAKIEKIKKESPDRINVELRQWVQTGLASLAHIKYDKQLEFKRNQVVNLLHKADLDKIYLVQKKLAIVIKRKYQFARFTASLILASLESIRMI